MKQTKRLKRKAYPWPNRFADIFTCKAWQWCNHNLKLLPDGVGVSQTQETTMNNLDLGQGQYKERGVN